MTQKIDKIFGMSNMEWDLKILEDFRQTSVLYKVDTLPPKSIPYRSFQVLLNERMALKNSSIVFEPGSQMGKKIDSTEFLPNNLSDRNICHCCICEGMPPKMNERNPPLKYFQIVRRF